VGEVGQKTSQYEYGAMKFTLFRTNNQSNNNNNHQKLQKSWFEENPKKTLVLIFLTIMFSLFSIAEIMIRTYYKEFRVTNFRMQGINLLKSNYPAKFDKLIGHIPKEGYDNSSNNFTKQKITVLRDGIRSNDNNINPNGGQQRFVILAVGDSFTFGDEVSNHETWPSYLERMTGVRVINGGVFGYGLDQIVLRSVDLITKYKPNLLIVSFVKDDLKRCGLKIRTNIPKPYYIIKNNELVLVNSHLSENEIAKLSQRNILLNPLGYSFLIHKTMSDYARLYWFQGVFRYEEKSGENYQEIALRLMAKLKDIEDETSTKVIIMPQYEFNESIKSLNELKYFKDVAADSGMEIIDLLDDLMNIKANNNNKYSEMFIGTGHMSPEGNEWVAAELANQLYLNNHIPLLYQRSK
jgi:hypothetical protein